MSKTFLARLVLWPVRALRALVLDLAPRAGRAREPEEDENELARRDDAVR